MIAAQYDQPCPASLPVASDSHALLWAGTGLFALLFFTLVFHQGLAEHSPRAVRECVHGLLAVGLAYTYLRGYRAVQACPDASRAVPAIVGFGAAFILVAVFIKPFHSADIFSYINAGWLQAHYGINPYTNIPGDIPGWQRDPMFFAEWAHTHTVYGFLYTSLCKLLCWAGQGDLWTTVLLFKALNALVYGLTAWVVWLGCRVQLHGLIKTGSGRLAERGLYLFLWNPLLLLHAIGNGHNDLLMGLLTATSIYLALRGAWLWVLPALMAGALIKFGSAVLLPFAFLYLVKRHGWRKAILSAGLALGVAVLFSAPWISADAPMADWFRLAARTTEMHDSLSALVFFPFEIAAKAFPQLAAYEAEALATVKLVFWAGFLGLVAYLAKLRLGARRYEPAIFVRDCLLLQFVLVCVVSSKYYGWYLGMFFPLALWVASDDWLHRATLAFSCAQLVALTFISKAHGLNEVVMLLIPLAWALWPSAFFSWSFAAKTNDRYLPSGRRTEDLPLCTSEAE